MRVLLLACLLSVCGAACARAEGSVQLDQLRPLFEAAPGLGTALESFEVEPAGTARRLGGEFLHLAGTRTAPYRFRVHPLGSPQWTLELTIQSELTWLGPRDEELPESRRHEAVRVAERLDRLELRVPPAIVPVPAPIEPDPVDDFRPRVPAAELAAAIDADLARVDAAERWIPVSEADHDAIGFHLHRARPLPEQADLARCIELEIEITVARSVLLSLWLDDDFRPRLLRAQDVFWDPASGEVESRQVRRFYFEQGRFHHVLDLRELPSGEVPTSGLPDPEAALLHPGPLAMRPLASQLETPDAAQRRTIETLVHRLAGLGLGRRPLRLDPAAPADPMGELVERLAEWITAESSPLFPASSWPQDETLLLDPFGSDGEGW